MNAWGFPQTTTGSKNGYTKVRVLLNAGATVSVKTSGFGIPLLSRCFFQANGLIGLLPLSTTPTMTPSLSDTVPSPTSRCSPVTCRRPFSQLEEGAKKTPIKTFRDRSEANHTLEGGENHWDCVSLYFDCVLNDLERQVNAVSLIGSKEPSNKRSVQDLDPTELESRMELHRLLWLGHEFWQ